MQVTSEGRHSPRALQVAIALTLMASGRAMTLAFITRAGNGGAGDPPKAWLMPLIGDAVVGIAALGVAWLLWTQRNQYSWLIAVVWSSIAAFDALAAFVVDVSAPWPEFFMIEIFGRSMFFAAAAMHLAIISLLARPQVTNQFGISAGSPVLA